MAACVLTLGTPPVTAAQDVPRGQPDCRLSSAYAKSDGSVTRLDSPWRIKADGACFHTPWHARNPLLKGAGCAMS
jgi:hypothetical protein